ncbi:hypothetical protein NADFUDRAFT_7619, partial [Nadsonia fulvescens var. elongata DSM 6958]
SLLTFDNVRVLIDMGWDPKLKMKVDYLSKIISSVDLILLTHASISHLGAYAYTCHVNPSMASIPVYATLPVINMGRMVTLEAYRSAGLLGPLLNAEITVSDVEAIFDRIIPLKYSQPTALIAGTLKGLTISAYNSGHSLGGTIWRLQKDQENVVYAVDWNHSKDSHLNGAAFLAANATNTLHRPTVLVCGTKTSSGIGRRKRDEALFRSVQETLERGGTVLLPTSTGSRFLELAHILSNHFQSHNLNYPLFYLSHMGSRTMSYASSMLEWMSSSIIREWETKNESPFRFKNITVTSNMAEILRSDGPKVVMVSGEEMEIGFSKLLFTKLCAFNNTRLIITEKPDPDTLCGELYQLWEANNNSNNNINRNNNSVALALQLPVVYNTEVPLENEELARFVENMSSLKRSRERLLAMEQRNKTILEQEENFEQDGESSDEEELIMTGNIELGMLIYSNDTYDFDARSHAKKRLLASTTSEIKNCMFPFFQKRRRITDYGETIRAEDFAIRERKPATVTAPIEANNNEHLGEKHKWNDDLYGDETALLDSTSSLYLTTNGHDTSNAAQKPVKMILQHDVLDVLCLVEFIDFEGLADERSMMMIIPRIQPKKLIFVGPVNEPTLYDELADTYTSLLGSSAEVYGALTNIPINASVNTHSVNIVLSDQLSKSLRWQKIPGNWHIAHLVGRLKVITKNDGDDDEENERQSTFVLEPLSVDNSVNSTDLVTISQPFTKSSSPLLVGDIRLSELRHKLISLGFRTEFGAEGVLVCEKKVIIRKNTDSNGKENSEEDTDVQRSSSKVVIEGGISEEFYKIKDIVRQMLAKV